MIEFIMPVMRPNSALNVLNDLKNQTKLIDRLIVVDNGGDFQIKGDYPFNIKVLRPLHNIGTNAAWNMVFNSKADYVGLTGDDYELENTVIEKLIKAFKVHSDAGATTAKIFKDTKIDTSIKRESGLVIAKGHMAVTIFNKGILNCLPRIPKELFVFYGDNWFGYWLNMIERPMYEINTGVSHWHKIDLKIRVGYERLKKTEGATWRAWKRQEIQL